MNIEKTARDITEGRLITKNEAMELYSQDLEELSYHADEIRKKMCGNRFDMCAIVNARCGHCSENCRFCAQSSSSSAMIKDHPLLSAEEIAEDACRNAGQGILRYSIVTSGRRLSSRQVDLMCDAVRLIHERCSIRVCVSFGLLDEEDFRKLREAGVSRVHNNLETSRRNFPNICTTHTYDDKIRAVKAAQAAGLEVCSGGIMGIGETPEDRIDMAFELRELGIKSVPVNMLNPIPGTPFGDLRRLESDDMRRIAAIYRFILPDAFIRMAGGRGLLEDKGRSCFTSGANAAISGDMLTTSGITAAADRSMLAELGYEVRLS